MNCNHEEKFTMAPYRSKAEELLNKMTLREKIGQLSLFGSLKEMKMNLLKEGCVGGLLNVFGAAKVNHLQKIAVEETRLGIPLLIGDDVIHGFSTIFPIPLGTASSWDMDAIERAESVSAKEAFVSGVNWIYTPMVDICRDPRWGRVAEGAGEDTYLGCQVAKARVRGLQTINPDTGYPYVAACPKHFAGYGLAEGGRDYDGADISEKTLFETYLPPYKAAIDAGAMSIMSSFNTLNGDPVSGSHYFLTEVLREQFGFEGFVVSDWESIMELMYHQVVADRKGAARLGITAGNDMDMHSGVYIEHLEELVKENPAIIDCINESVVRILCVKYALGLFENPYRDFEGERIILSQEFRDTARDVAKRSMVLLKNDNQTLPLNDKNKTLKILVTGPLANSQEDMIGMWGCKGNKWDVVTLLQAVRSRENVDCEYIRGCEIDHMCHCDFERAKEMAKDCDAILYACGEPEGWTGEIHCRTDISLPQVQSDYVKALKETGKPVIAVLMTGRPLCCTQLEESADAILLAWHAGVEAGNAVCDCVFGDYAPAGKLPITFPRSTGQIPVYYSRLSSGRPYEWFIRYLDCDVAPLYPFGHGLTYSPISYSDFVIENPEISQGDTLKFSVTLTNNGTIDTEEVAQIYFHDVVSSMATPVRKLCAFKKAMIPAGKSVTLSFAVDSREFAFLNRKLVPVLEEGEFILFAGGDSNCTYSQNFHVINR